MHGARSERRSAWPAVVLGALLLLPAIYVASIGPAGRFVTMDNYRALEDAYAPILWATDRSDVLNVGLQGYLRFCGAEDGACIVAVRRGLITLRNSPVALPRF